MKVLLAESQQPLVRIIRNLFIQIGIVDVVAVGDGEAALQAMRDNSFDMVLAHNSLAPMTGLQLLKAIRADAQFSRTPFIMFMANSAKICDEISTATQAGLSNFLIWPFDADTLQRKVESVTRR